MKFWQRSLADYSWSEAINALEYWVNTEEKPPNLAQFKPIIVKLANPRAIISPERAWEAVSDAVRRFGSYGQERAFETFSEPIKRAVRNVGGWHKICSTELGRDWDFLKRNFIDAFNDFGQETREQELLPTPVLQRLQALEAQRQLDQRQQEKLENPK